MLSGIDFKKELFEKANRNNTNIQNNKEYNHTMFEFDGHKIQQYELHEVGVGGHLWESAKVLSNYLLEKLGKEYFKNKKAIELGSGTALLGLCVSVLGADVTVSDKFDTLDLLKKNVNANQSIKATIKDYSWGEGVDNMDGPYQLIVGSELIYNGRIYDILVKSFDLLSVSGTEFIMSFERRATEDQFLEMIKDKWETIKVIIIV
eukprot:TRINITY_DN2317_c0_g1_i2.p1 TRINITY_DN2317_c0_g1~~TRINITY_DN2317_c0_g1_i2.p1  ORF type:complete len:205 (-),score=45.23 TRINITY_DN2317_c0_g1_i2:273-887(-)